MEKKLVDDTLPLVSIFAVCHNHKSFVVETLESIRRQTYPNIQLIIINNLTDDGCREIIEAWIQEHQVDCEFIQNERPLSVTKNWNLGLKKASGKYFQGIACDDILKPKKIEKQVLRFEALSSQYACIYTDEERIGKDGELIKEETLFQERIRKYNLTTMPKGNLMPYFSEITFISPVSCLLRTEVVRKINGFDEEFFIEDWPLYLKLSKEGFLFDNIEEVCVQYRILPNSLSNGRSWKFHVELLRIFVKYKKYLVKSPRVSLKIRFYLIDVAKNSLILFLFFYISLFSFTPKDLRTHLKYLRAIILK